MKLEDLERLYRAMLYHYVGDVDILADYIGVTTSELKEKATLFTSFDRNRVDTLNKLEKSKKTTGRFCLYFYLGSYSSLDFALNGAGSSTLFEQAEEYAMKYGTKEEKAAFEIQKNKLGTMEEKEEKVIEQKMNSLMEILKRQDQKDCIIRLASVYQMKPSVLLEELKKVSSKDVPKYLGIAGTLMTSLPASKQEMFYRAMVSQNISVTAKHYGISDNSLWKVLRDYYKEATPLERRLYCFSIKQKQQSDAILSEKKSIALGSILYENIDLDQMEPDYFEKVASHFGLPMKSSREALSCYCRANGIVCQKRIRTSIVEHAKEVAKQLDHYDKEGVRMSDGTVRPYDFVDFYFQCYPFVGNSYTPMSKDVIKNKKHNRWHKLAQSITNNLGDCLLTDTLLDPKRFSIQQQVTYPNGEVAVMSLFCNLEIRKQCVDFMRKNHLAMSDLIMRSLLERSRYGNHVYEIPSDMKFLDPKQKEKVKIK